MELEPLEMLTEEVIREAIGSELTDRALLDLLKNKVVQRTRFSGDEIYARWDFQPNSPEMRVAIQEDDLLTLCTCQTFRQAGICAHIAGLLIAWASQRETFQSVQSTETLPGQIPAGRAQAQPEEKPFDVVDNFRQFLNEFTVTELREIARRRDVSISGIRKDPIVDSLAKAFSVKEKLCQDWQRLSPQARLVGGLLPFLVNYINPASLEQAAQPLGVKGKAFTDALDELKTSGWVYEEHYGGLHFPAVLPVWIPPDAGFVDAAPFNTGSLTVQTAPAPQSFSQAITRLLILIQAAPDSYQARVDARSRELGKKLPMLEDWPVEAQDLERASRDPRPYQYVLEHGLHIASAPSLLTSEAGQKLAAAMQAAPEEIDFLIRLLLSQKLLQHAPGKPLRAAPDALMKILQNDTLQFARQLFAAYASMQGWAEIDLALARSKNFRLVLRNYNQGNYTYFLRSLTTLREKLVLMIRRLPAGEWIAIKDVARRAYQFPFSALLRGTAGFGYFEVNGRKMNLDRGEDGQELISRFLEAMLSGPMYWQGAVDLAAESGRVTAFRITGLGSVLLAHPVDFEMPKAAQDAPALRFTGEGDLAIQLETASGQLIGLATMLGSIEVSGAGAVIIRPTLLGAGRAFEAGWSADRLLDLLAVEAGQAPPGALANTLQKWWQDFGRVQIYQGVALMEFNDDYALNELLAGTSLPRYLLYRFSPRLIAIRPEGADELRSELVKKGYTPKTAA